MTAGGWAKAHLKLKKKGSAELPEPEPDFVSSQKNWYLPFTLLLELLFFFLGLHRHTPRQKQAQQAAAAVLHLAMPQQHFADQIFKLSELITAF